MYNAQVQDAVAYLRQWLKDNGSPKEADSLEAIVKELEFYERAFNQLVESMK